MLDLAVRDIHPHDTLVVHLLVQHDTLVGAGIATFQEDYRVVYPYEPREAKGLHRVRAVCDSMNRRKGRATVALAWTPCIVPWGGTQELRQSIRLLGAQGQGTREALRVGGPVASISQTHMGSHDGVDVVGDDVKKFCEVSDQDVQHPALKPA